MLDRNSPLQLPTLKESQVIFEESLIKIKRDQLQIGSHPSYNYYSLITPPCAVAVLAITPEGSYVLNREYRHPTHRILLGCPGGYIDSNEDPLQAAKRELMEETGFHAYSFKIIGSAFPYSGFSGQKTIYIRALDATLITHPQPEVSEIIAPTIFTPEELIQAIASGAELDGTLCSALFFHQLHEYSFS